MLHSYIIDIGDIKKNLRFDVRFIFYNFIIREQLIKRGFSFQKLSSLVENVSDGEHSHVPRIKTKGIRYLYGRNIKEGIINFDPDTDSSYISQEDYDSFPRTHLKEDDVLLTIVGTIGKSAVYNSNYVGKAGIPRHIAKISVGKESKITPEYLCAYFRSKIGKNQMYSITTGNIQPLLAIKNIKSIDIIVPNKSFIDKITNIEKKALKNEIDSLNLIKEAKAIFYKELNIEFSKKEGYKSFVVNRNDLSMSSLWNPANFLPGPINILETIKKRYKMVSIGELCEVCRGKEVGSGNYNNYLESKNNDIPFIRTTDIINYQLDINPDFFIPREIYEELNQDLTKNDVLYTKDGKIGLTALVTDKDKAIIASGIERLRVKKEFTERFGISPEYVFLVLSIKEVGLSQAIKSTVVASTIPHLREERLKEILIPICDNKIIAKISKLVKKAFELKAKKISLIKYSKLEMEKITTII